MNSKLVVAILVIGTLAASALAIRMIGSPVAKEPKKTFFIVAEGDKPDAPPDAVSDVATQFFARWITEKGEAELFHIKAPLEAEYIAAEDVWHVSFRRKRADVRPSLTVVIVKDNTLQPTIKPAP